MFQDAGHLCPLWSRFFVRHFPMSGTNTCAQLEGGRRMPPCCILKIEIGALVLETKALTLSIFELSIYHETSPALKNFWLLACVIRACVPHFFMWKGVRKISSHCFLITYDYYKSTFIPLWKNIDCWICSSPSFKSGKFSNECLQKTS